jgi:hypothetical protein
VTLRLLAGIRMGMLIEAMKQEQEYSKSNVARSERLIEISSGWMCGSVLPS